MGSRVLVLQHRATVRYVGHLEGQEGVWVGVEYDEPDRGKHDGTVAAPGEGGLSTIRRFHYCLHHAATQHLTSHFASLSRSNTQTLHSFSPAKPHGYIMPCGCAEPQTKCSSISSFCIDPNLHLLPLPFSPTS